MRWILLLFFLVSVDCVVAQRLLDDSTKLIYGPQTTRYRLKEDFFFRKDTLRTIDTTLDYYHNQDDFTLLKGYPMQDLGIMGSPQRPVFFRPTETIGLQFGFNALDSIYLNTLQTPYINTRSPYSYFKYTQGGAERTIFEAAYSRNILNRWNIAAEYRRVGVNKVYGATRPEDPLTDFHSIRLNTNYTSNDGRLILLFSFTNSYLRFFETGGVLPSARDSTREENPKNRTIEVDSLFLLEIQRVQLAPNTFSLRNIQQYLGYAEYALTKSGVLQAYYKFQKENNNYTFEDPNPQAGPFYRNRFVFQYPIENRPEFSNGQGLPLGVIFNINQNSTSDKLAFQSNRHEVGLKGSLLNLFYHGGIQYRNISYGGNNTFYYGLQHELHVNGGLRAYFDDFKIYSSINYVLGRDYALAGSFQANRFSAEIRLIRSSPDLFKTQFSGNHFDWRNNLDFTNTRIVAGTLKIFNEQNRSLLGRLELSQTDGLIVFNQFAKPQQINATINNAVLNLEYSQTWNRFKVIPRAFFALNNAQDVVRQPMIWLQMPAFFQYQPKGKKILLQLGAELRYRTAYQADFYMPVTQQFYIQGNPNTEVAAADRGVLMLSPTFVLDPFANIRINRTLIFVKVNNALQGIGGNGYFATPFYPGVGRNFQLGLTWHFFD